MRTGRRRSPAGGGGSTAGTIGTACFALLLLAGCRLEPAFERLENRVSFSDVVIEHLGEQWRGQQSHRVDPGNKKKDVFFIVSNPRNDERGAAELHVPEREESASAGTHDSGDSANAHISGTRSGSEHQSESGLVPSAFGLSLRTAGLSPRTADLPPLSATGDTSPEPQTSYTVNDKRVFHGLTDGTGTRNAFNAVLRNRKTHGNTTLKVWVAKDINNDTYQEVADAIAEAFFDNGDGDGNPGIFEITTTLFGDFWGPNDRSAVIGDTDTVDVVLFDIGGTDSPDNAEATVLGYFDARDLYRKSVIDDSAERAVVYLHGPAFAEDDSGNGSSGTGKWSAGDRWPAEMLLTVAHEFQHLINFYEKRVRRGVPADTWLDELMSLQAEELTGSLLQEHSIFDGIDTGGILRSPRGLPAACARSDPDSTSNSCSIDNTFARARAYNSGNNHARSLTAWDEQEVRYRLSGTDLGPDYAASYLFGAWLMRNFGLRGGFLYGLNDNVSGGRDAVTGAVRESARAQGFERSDYSFGQLLDLWKSALVLSDLSADDDGVPLPYRMSKAPADSNSNSSSDFFKLRPSEIGESGDPLPEMLLGSVDIWEYERTGQSVRGPNYGRLDDNGRWKSPGNRMEAVSSQVVHIPSVDAPVTINYSVPPGASVTVVVRPPAPSSN